MLGALSTNIPSLLGQQSLTRNLLALSQSMEQLATGFRINRGADDPAGLIASEALRAALAVIEAETRAAERAQYVIATADGAMGAMSDLLVEAESLVVANANSAGMSDAEREANQLALNSILSAVNRIAGSTTFNGDPLLDGTATINAAGDSITIQAISAPALDIVGGDLEEAQDTLHGLQSHIATQRAELGAFSSKTVGPFLITSSIAMQNIAAANSLIRDTDYAFETANLARLMVLSDSSRMAIMLASTQAQNVLSLIG
jgi:flagellin